MPSASFGGVKTREEARYDIGGVVDRALACAGCAHAQGRLSSSSKYFEEFSFHVQCGEYLKI